ncbi:hypothetical protein JKJ01_10990 [Mycolicibacterium fortuitum]|nr:hypothetical protein [Mycolicibacterium fortuitum]
MRIAISGAGVAAAALARFGLWYRDVAMRAMNLGRPIAGLFAGSLRDNLDLPDYRI